MSNAESVSCSCGCGGRRPGSSSLPAAQETAAADALAALDTNASVNFPGPRKTVIRIIGLDCADCAAKLEKKIAAMAGVQLAQINFGAGKLTVIGDMSAGLIIEAIEQAGYQAGQERKTGESSWWKNGKMLATAASGLTTAAAAAADFAGVGANIAIFLYFLAIIIGGYHVAKSGFYSLKSFIVDTNILMIVAAAGAVAIGEWSEAATVVFLFSLGNALQAYTIEKTRRSIQALMELAPQDALVLRGGGELRLPVEEITVGDVMIVKPGERIALDGVVQSGSSAVNQAAITGESMPADKAAGDTVYAGTINGQGVLEVVVTALAEDTTLAKIIAMVEDAQAQKAPSQQYVDIFARYYTPAVIAVAIGLATIPWLMFNQPFNQWLYKALVLLVISCPCALVISTPVAIVAGIGNASQNGVLIKGGAYLEEVGRVKAVAFDKTGTLTQGKPVVTDIVAFGELSEQAVLRLAASLEKLSEHPVAGAVMARAAGLELLPAAEFQAIAGKGVQARILGEKIYAGNRRLFREAGMNLEEYRDISNNRTVQQQFDSGFPHHVEEDEFHHFPVKRSNIAACSGGFSRGVGTFQMPDSAPHRNKPINYLLENTLDNLPVFRKGAHKGSYQTGCSHAS